MTVWMPVLWRTALFWVMVAAPACKTTKEPGDQEGSVTTSAGTATPGHSPKIGTLSLTQSTSQQVYLKVLGTEFDSGAKIPKDQVHINRGLLSCHKNIERDVCSLRGRQSDQSLGSEQFLDLPVIKELSTLIREARRDIPDDQDIVADVECDYLGQNSPPFGVERASCRVFHPRRLEEVVFAENAADVLMSALRGEEPLGEGQKELKGALVCHVGDLAFRATCFVRPISERTTANQVVELAHDQVVLVAKNIERAVADRLKLNAESAGSNGKFLPRDVTLDLKCKVDSSEVQGGGERHVQCSGRF